MKLKEIHLFLILLGVLLLSNLGFIIKEGLEGGTDAEKAEAAEKEEKALDAISKITKAAAGGWNEGSGSGNIVEEKGKNTEEKKEDTALNETMAAGKTLEGSGEDEKYILKSSIVPPVCPKCPSLGGGGGGGGGASSGDPNSRQKCETTACPPCPACARCPEQPFTCKKVPDYKHISSKQLPKPVLTNFSKFSS